MRSQTFRWTIWVVVFAGLLSMISVFSLFNGSSTIAFKTAIATIFEGRGSPEYSILFDIRLPRIMLGCAVGGALSLAGVLLQRMFRNPLVEPYTLGISGGAALGVCINIVLHVSQTAGILTVPFFGFLGAVAVILLLYSLSISKGRLKMQGLLLTGVMISFISSSLMMLIMAVSRTEDLHGIIFWIMGSLEEPSWFLIKLMLSVAIFGLAVSYLFCHDLNALSLGEEEALHLGVNIERDWSFPTSCV